MNQGSERTPLYNPIGLVGIVLLLIGFVTGFTLFLMDLSTGESPAYLAIPYLLALVFLLGGLALIFLGRQVERYRRARGRPASRLDRYLRELNRTSPYYFALGLMGVVVIASTALGVGAYKAYQATQSNAFCGTVCHSVMEPEWVAYHESSHARVDCVQCHVGSGAGWYLRSKFAGVSRMVSMMTGTVPRPIPTPIHNLRPARETCEQCHWPSRFIGYEELVHTYYRADEASTPYRLRMLLKIGGRESGTAMGWGIHYHMLVASQVEYIARDDRNQEIVWVRIQRPDGSVTEYEHYRNAPTPEERESLEVRVMDCMDCHNRPAHQFPAPVQSVNQAIAQGRISRELPYAKLRAVTALSGEYETTEAAMAGLEQAFRGFYEEEYPEVAASQAEALEQGGEALREIYRRTAFPQMRVNWATYPDHIGHRDSPGCFRCHNEDLEAADGSTIFTTCQKCHLFLAQGEDVDNVTVDYREGVPFQHPDDGEPIDEATECVDCHTGDAVLYE